MAKYYYDKYSTNYSAWSDEKQLSTSTTKTNANAENGYEGITWKGNMYDYIGIFQSRDHGYNNILNGDLQCSYDYFSYYLEDDGWHYVNRATSGRTRTKTKGSLISTIIAEDGTYPNDGIYSDGYWYVKGALAFPIFKIKIDGGLKTSSDGWVKIDGVLRHIEGMWAKADGVLKKI